LCFGACEGMRLCSICLIAGLMLKWVLLWCVVVMTEVNAFTYAALAAFMNTQVLGFLRKGHYLTEWIRVIWRKTMCHDVYVRSVCDTDRVSIHRLKCWCCGWYFIFGRKLAWIFTMRLFFNSISAGKPQDSTVK
jgi:hypothetical protein